jgi:integrase
LENHLNFTKAALDTLPLPPEGKRATYHDQKTPGLQLRVTPSGIKTFSVFRRIGGGQPERATLGRYPTISIEQARRKAAEINAILALGNSHKEQKQAKKASSITLNEVLEEFLASRKNLSERTRYDYRRIVKTYLWDWADKPIASISKDMVEKRHTQIATGFQIPSDKAEGGWKKATSEAQANYSMRCLRALINFAAVKYEGKNGISIIQENPVKRLSQTRSWYRIDRRQTVIKTHELPAWFSAVLNLRSDAVNGKADVVRDYLIFLLLTGLRRNEAAKLKRSDIDLKARSFTVVDTKNKQPHTLPFSDYLFDLVKRRLNELEGEFVFPGTGAGGYLVEPKKQLKKVIEASGVSFTLHDLRRTFASIAENLDISAYALKRLLNHKMRNDVTAGYIVSDVERLRAPMQKITDFILSVAQQR